MPHPALGPESGQPIRRPRPDQIERFWARVQKGPGCWTWTGHRSRSTGYGCFALRDQRSGPFPAHRVSYAIAHGGLPAGRVVMHACDNKPCVNPAHLRLGTQRDNVLDAIAKGRIARSPVCGKCGGERDFSTTAALCSACLAAARANYYAKHAKTGRSARLAARLATRVPEGLPDTFEALVAAVRDERRALILARNFGLYHFASPEKLTAIAPDFGLTRERTRQLVVSACRRLSIEPRTFWGPREAA